MKIRNLCAVLIVFALFANAEGQVKSSKDQDVIVEMNYCINTLTNIIHNKSMAVLEHESDQLINNLTMEHIVGLYEIEDFREDLIGAIGKFEITEEERSLMRRIRSIKRDNMKWNALSNALNPTMLLTGNGGGMKSQLAFQVLLTAARSAVEYKTMEGEQNIEELQAMWELRKTDMETINDTRKNAQRVVFDLYNKYHLKEGDRLTENTANLFNEYVSEADAAKRVRILEDNVATYRHIPEYYYHLGMAYLDSNNYAKAKVNFSKYLEIYGRSPFLRYDERSGCIALTMLTYEKNLSAGEIVDLINLVIKNMPNNSAAFLQCALIYIHELKQYEEGFQLIRSGIDNIHATDRNSLYMAAANMLPAMKEYKTIYNAIFETLKNAADISYDALVTYLVNSNNNAWSYLNNLNRFSNCYKRTWYSCWLDKKFTREFHLTLPNNVIYNSNDFFVYEEEHDENHLTIRQIKGIYKKAIYEDDVNDVKCFKENKNLKYLYMEAVEPGIYRLKKNIDLVKIKSGDWPRQGEFSLSEDDQEDIVDFCEGYMDESDETELVFKDVKSSKHKINGLRDCKVVFYGDTLLYKPHHSKKQEGHYVRIVLSNGIQVVYKYENETLQPYYYSDGKRMVFWNSDAKSEYTYTEKSENSNKNSWLSQIWSFVSDSFSSSTPVGIIAKEVKKSWLDDVWTSATGWISSNKNDSIPSSKVKKHEENDNSSWYSSAWHSVSSWFSSGKENDNKEKK